MRTPMVIAVALYILLGSFVIAPLGAVPAPRSVVTVNATEGLMTPLPIASPVACRDREAEAVRSMAARTDGCPTDRCIVATEEDTAALEDIAVVVRAGEPIAVMPIPRTFTFGIGGSSPESIVLDLSARASPLTFLTTIVLRV